MIAMEINLTITMTHLQLETRIMRYTLRENISRGYPFFFCKKGSQVFFYSVLFIYLSLYN